MTDAHPGAHPFMAALIHHPPDTDPDPKPCGTIHPLPCGLDRDCVVPVEFFEAGVPDPVIWRRYARQQRRIP